MGSGLLSSEPSLFSLRKEDIASILMGSSGVWEDSNNIENILGQLGKSKEQDQERLEHLVSKMIATEPNEQKLGLSNMTMTFINFTK
jgi:hypothetical protein